MKKIILLFLYMFVILLFLSSCEQRETASISDESQEDHAFHEDNNNPPRELESENSNINSSVNNDSQSVPEPQCIDEWLGAYSYYGYTQKEQNDKYYLSIELLIYEESGNYYGYLNVNGSDEEYAHFYERILTEIKGTQDMIQAFFLESFYNEENCGDIFNIFGEGELLFSIQKGRDYMLTKWEKIQMLETREAFREGFRRDEELFVSVTLMNEADRANFLRAFDLTVADPFFQYFNDDTLFLELYYDMEEKAGIGIYHGPLAMCGFNINEYESGKWQEYKFSFDKEEYDASTLEEYKEYHIYNDNNQLTHYYSEGIIEGWADSPYLDKVIEIEFFYREDGSLERKRCYYNSRLFGTTRQTEDYYYDSDERLVYVFAYITHGFLQDYYIYESGDEPSYRLTLDHMGWSAWVDAFIKY